MPLRSMCGTGLQIGSEGVTNVALKRLTGMTKRVHTRQELEETQRLFEEYSTHLVPSEILRANYRELMNDPALIASSKAQLASVIEVASTEEVVSDSGVSVADMLRSIDLDEPIPEEYIDEEICGHQQAVLSEFFQFMINAADRSGGSAHLDYELCPTEYPNMWKSLRRLVWVKNEDWKTFVAQFVENVRGRLPLKLPNGYAIEADGEGFVVKSTP